MIRASRLAVLLLPFAAALLLAAAPPVAQESPEELVRRANDLFRAGNVEGADALYAAAEERTTDPGLVSFNRAAIFFERGQFREAEKLYDHVLDDADCPAERAAKAWYNRGTCLLHRGGSLSVYRSAIACFEHAIDSPAAGEPLKADARHNLEIAKLLWIEQAKKEQEQKKEPPSPNENIPPEEQKQPKPEPDTRPGGQDANPTTDKNGTTTPKPGTQVQGKDNVATPAPKDPQNVPGNNPNLQPIEDTSEVQKLSPEEARAYLKETSKRRKRELHSLLESLYGPDRVDVRDW